MTKMVTIAINNLVVAPAVTTMTVNRDKLPVDWAEFSSKHPTFWFVDPNAGYKSGMVKPTQVSVNTQLDRAERLNGLLEFLSSLDHQRFEAAFEVLDEALWDWQFESTPDSVVQRMKDHVDQQIKEGKVYPIR